MTKKKLRKIIRHPKKTISDARYRKKHPEVIIAEVPRITSETVAEHREEVLAGARKYIYPLQHSKHKIVFVSTALSIVAFVGFMTYCLLSIYRYHATSTFIYRVSQVIPFPVARVKGSYVSYESYLFEVRHTMHYYVTQSKVDFGQDANKPQLLDIEQKALDKVVDDAYIKRLAKDNGVSVSEQEVTLQIDLARTQNRLGGSTEVFEDVLRNYYGWSVQDFRRQLKQQLLAQKVVAKLDTATHERANSTFSLLTNGADFAATAKSVSDDAETKENGGEFGSLIDKSNASINSMTIDALFKLQPGQHSKVIDIGYGLEIVKLIEMQSGEKAKAAHIVFNYKPVDQLLNETKEKQKARSYITLK